VTEELLTLRQWIGQAVRRLRDEHGRRQDDVAVAARSVGLAWTRGKVAELERGGKAIPAEELLLLPVVLAYAGCGEPQLRDLIPDGQHEELVLNSRVAMPAHVLHRIAEGTARFFDYSFSEPAAASRSYDWAQNSRYMRGHEAIWQGEPQGGIKSYEDSHRDAERDAARRLGVPAEALSSAAHATWGRGLTEERDARVAAAAEDGADERSLQAARGHVARTLYRELEPALDRWRAAVEVD
jgi:hypothetical protein